MTKKGDNSSDKKPRKVKDEVTKGNENKPKTSQGIARGKSEFELDALLNDCALKPNKITLEQIAEKYGLERRQLYELRKEHAERIEQIQRDFFAEHKGNVIKALLESCEGFEANTPKGVYQHPPNPKSIEFFFGLANDGRGNNDSDPYRLFDEFYPLHKQAQFIYSGDPLGKFTLNFLISGIGFGKTAALVEKALILARRNRKRIGMIVAPTYKMLQHPILEYLFARLNQLGIKYKHKKADGELELWGDTTILLRSADNPDNLRGPTIAWCVGDEIRNWDKMAYDICLGRVRDPNARDRQFAATTTPDGFNWIYDEVEGERASKQKGDGQLYVYYARTEDNPHLPADFVELVKATYSTEFAEQELDGKFLPVGQGLIYNCFNRNIHIKECELFNNEEVWIGQDFNVNPMATVITQARREGDKTIVYVTDELAIKGSVHDTLEELKNRGLAPSDRIKVFPDATGFNKSANSTRSSGQLFQDAGYNVINQRTNPLIRDRYAAVNGKLKNAKGEVTMYISPRCKNLIKDLEREVYKEGTSIREATKDGAKDRGHWADALGYPIHLNFNIESAYNYNYRSW